MHGYQHSVRRLWSESCISLAVPSSCSKLPDVSHAKVSTHNTEVGTKVKFTCDPGYNIIGNASVKCMATGKWSSSTPLCIRKHDLYSPHFTQMQSRPKPLSNKQLGKAFLLNYQLFKTSSSL